MHVMNADVNAKQTQFHPQVFHRTSLKTLLTLDWGEEDLGCGCSFGPLVLRDRFSVVGLAAQSHVASHHGVSGHAAHRGRRRDCRDRFTGSALQLNM